MSLKESGRRVTLTGSDSAPGHNYYVSTLQQGGATWISSKEEHVHKCSCISLKINVTGQTLLDLRKRASQQRLRVGHNQEHRCGLDSDLRGLQLQEQGQSPELPTTAFQPCQKTRFPTASQAVRQGCKRMTYEGYDVLNSTACNFGQRLHITSR